MIHWPDLRDLMWDARWDAIVMLANATWQASLDNPWLFVVFALALLTLTRRGWAKLIRYIAGTFVKSHVR